MRNTKRLSRLLVATLALLVAPWCGAARAEPYDTVVLQALDKVTARVSTVDVEVGTTFRFGTLEIVARTCDKRPPEEPPESAAFLDISEVRPGEAMTDLFHGWMFASSPALSALEHPVYDVWVLDCRNKASTSAQSPGVSPPQ